MSERRLINKKAYEEMILLQEFCERYDDEDKGIGHYVALSLDEEGKERFTILVGRYEVITEVLFGKNYAEISKRFMEYINEQRI